MKVDTRLIKIVKYQFSAKLINIRQIKDSPIIFETMKVIDLDVEDYSFYLFCPKILL